MYSGRTRRRASRSSATSGAAPARRHHVGDQPQVPGPLLPRHHRRLAHRRMAGQRRLDLPQLDAEAAQLHLVVGAAQELDLAVGREARQVARPVEPLAGVGREAGRGRSARPSGRAGRGSRAPGPRRRCTARRARPPAPAAAPGRAGRRRVLAIGRPIGTVRACRPRQRPVRRHVDRRLGGAVEVVQLGSRRAPEQLVEARRELGRQRLAARHHPPQRAAAARGPALLEEDLQHRRHEVERRHPLLARSAASGRPDPGGRPAGPAPAARRPRAARRAPRPTRRS